LVSSPDSKVKLVRWEKTEKSAKLVTTVMLDCECPLESRMVMLVNKTERLVNTTAKSVNKTERLGSKKERLGSKKEMLENTTVRSANTTGMLVSMKGMLGTAGLLVSMREKSEKNLC